MNEGEGRRWADPVADRRGLAKADGKVEAVVEIPPPAAKFNDRVADGASIDFGEIAFSLGKDGLDDRRARKVACSVFKEVGRAAKRGDHPREDLRRPAGGKRRFNFRARRGSISFKARDDQHFRCQLTDDLVEARFTFSAREVFGAFGDLDRVACAGAENLRHAGQDGMGLQPDR